MGKMKPIDKAGAGIVATKITEQYISPIPNAREMEGYRMVDPSFPDRIMKDFEANSEAVRELQRIGQQAAIDRDVRGQYISLGLGILILLVIAYAIHAKSEAALAGGTLATVATLVYKSVVYYTNRKYPKA